MLVDVTRAGAPCKTDFSLDAMEELLKAVKKFDLDTVNVFLGNPLDLLKMDMGKLPSNCYFISHPDCKKGELLMIKDNSLKEMLYTFAKNNPDRCFRGEKKENKIK